MAKIVKISSKFNENKVEKLALDLNDVYVVTLDGEFQRKNNLNIRATREVPESVKNAFSEVNKSFKRQLKIQEKKKAFELECEEKIRKEKQLQQEILKNARDNIGVLSFEEFKSKFEASLPKNIQSLMESLNFHVDSPMVMGYYGSGYLYISRYIIIRKYFRNASFLYEEYDGTVKFTINAENDESYISILKKHSAKLPFKNCEFKEHLNLGDKDTLSYSACYEIPLNEDLTEEYAKKLVKSICK